MSTITSANSQFAIVIPGVYNAPQILQGYATDDAILTEAVENVEAKIGVDGQSAGGYIFNLIVQNLVFQANSPSIDVFNNWSLAQKASREVIVASATLAYPSIGYTYDLKTGYLTKFKPTPDAKKVLQQVQHTISWTDIIGAKI